MTTTIPRISVESFRPMTVLYPGDIYELACVLLKIFDARDKLAFRERGGAVVSRPTVNGVAMEFAGMSRIDPSRIKDILVRHGLPLGAVVDPEAASESAPPPTLSTEDARRRRGKRKRSPE